MPGHYASERHVERVLRQLGKIAAAELVSEKLPTTKGIRSGDLGEIIATEYIEENTHYHIPIKRLRWKDHRNMALRGDDVIGMCFDEAGTLNFLKTEAKSRVNLAPSVLIEARTALEKHNGLCLASAWRLIQDGQSVLIFCPVRAHVEPFADRIIDLNKRGVTALAELVFNIPPFVPSPLPANWRNILRSWLLGEPIVDVAAGKESDALQFVEGGLIYRLPWAMEAIRVRAIANDDTTNVEGVTFEGLELNLAVSAVETGTMSRSAAFLIRAGFNSRIAAIKAVSDTNAQFESAIRLRQWLASDIVVGRTNAGDWPTVETVEMWRTFYNNFAPSAQSIWTERYYHAQVQWVGQVPAGGTPIQIRIASEGIPYVLSSTGEVIGRTNIALNPSHLGLLRADVKEDQQILINYIGPDDLWII